MRKKQANPKQIKRILMNYDKDKLSQALKAVQEMKFSVNKAALMYGVPAQTLRDRVLGKVKPDATMGKSTLFSKEEEELLVEHVEKLSLLGYGLNRSQVNMLAGELAIKLGRKGADEKMSNNWHYGFLNRWKDRLSVIKPRSLTSTRAECLTKERVNQYFDELDAILEKYDLKSKPHLIYNIDETGLQAEHRPASVIASTSTKPQAITSPKSTITTLIGCINAAGNTLPPFFVFKGKRLNPDLLHGALPGTGFAMSDSGWSNGRIFQKYLEEHFLKYAQTGVKNDDHVLLIFDGHASHVSLDIIDWAKNNKIILFVLPPHTSHVLQPLDVGCFSPLKGIYYSECGLWMARERGRVITRFQICELACKAFVKTMTLKNILSAFETTGISPLNRNAVPDEKFIPSESFVKNKDENRENQTKEDGTEVIKQLLEEKMERSAPKSQRVITQEKQTPALKRPSVGGRAVTEDNVLEELTTYQEQREKKKPKKSIKSKEEKMQMKKGKKNKAKLNKSKFVNDSQEPSTSTGISNANRHLIQHDEENKENEDPIEDNELCCVCRKYSPPGLRDCIDLVIVKWAECTKCGHWTHLRFCTDIRVVRRHGDFFCPHCKE